MLTTLWKYFLAPGYLKAQVTPQFCPICVHPVPFSSAILKLSSQHCRTSGPCSLFTRMSREVPKIFWVATGSRMLDSINSYSRSFIEKVGSLPVLPIDNSGLAIIVTDRTFAVDRSLSPGFVNLVSKYLFLFLKDSIESGKILTVLLDEVSVLLALLDVLVEFSLRVLHHGATILQTFLKKMTKSFEICLQASPYSLLPQHTSVVSSPATRHHWRKVIRQTNSWAST
jgi:hypothetical protein